MNILKVVFLSIIGLMVTFMVVGMLLPQTRHVERSAVISATPSEVFQQINNPKSFNNWSPWAKLDPNAQFIFVGPESGKGAGMTWSSGERSVGSGSWMITDTIENEHVAMDLDFGQGGASSTFDLKAEGIGTQIIWGFDMDMGMNPMLRWFGLMMENWVGADYEKGLTDLKSLVESN